MPTDFLSLFTVINAAQVPYVVVGGLAMLLHGIDRVTGDIDLVIDLAPGPSTDLVTTLINAGYRSFAPVDPALLANEAIRHQAAFVLVPGDLGRRLRERGVGLRDVRFHERGEERGPIS